MVDSSDVRVRFAPSPTGYLHVGGARTALFNLLFARHHGGKFAIRIEDTDIDRNIVGAESKILEDLKWLGIDYDEGPDVGGPFGPYKQSERRESYDAAAKKLLDSGAAYYAVESPEELAALRKAAEAEKRGFKYRPPTTPPTQAQIDQARASGHLVVRFSIPDEPITIHDEILGDVSFGAGELDDLVIVKSNGWPTYHFAVVVDDENMRISHILRAQEHLMNTPKHVFMQRALGYRIPKFAHLPLVFNIDGTKMSKRDKHKAVRTFVKNLIKQGKWNAAELAKATHRDEASVNRWLDKVDAEFDPGTLQRAALAASNVAGGAKCEVPEIDVHDFRLSGYLPEALANFVALIGWSPKDDREKLTREEMIEAFALDKINKTSGRFDREKLIAMNTDYAASLPPDCLLIAFKDWNALNSTPFGPIDDATAATVLEACKGFRTFGDVWDKAGALFVSDDSIQPEADAIKKVLAQNNGQGYANLAAVRDVLADIPDATWNADSIDTAIKQFAESRQLKLGDVAQPLRVAVAGRPVSPAIGVTLALLGRERTLNRIGRCLDARQE